MNVSTTPRSKLLGLGSSQFARRYYGNRFFFLFLGVLRCFSSPRYLLITYLFSYGYLSIKIGGFPHSEILGSKVVCTSPGLIAACHVLLRLLVPRHPPYALIYLTRFALFVASLFTLNICLSLFSFQGTVLLMVETRRIELLTPCVQGRCSPS